MIRSTITRLAGPRFTLLELLVVLAIIAILIGFVFPAVRRGVELMRVS